jgi:hypothetical protein
MNNTKEYILFLGQCACFQSRTILIPKNEFLKVRSNDYKILKSYSKNHILKGNNDKYYIVKNYLPDIINYKGNIGTQESTPYSNICNILMFYADRMDDKIFMDLSDYIWVAKSKYNLCGGFDHLENFAKLVKMTEYDGEKIIISNSFLFIEKND